VSANGSRPSVTGTNMDVGVAAATRRTVLSCLVVAAFFAAFSEPIYGAVPEPTPAAPAAVPAPEPVAAIVTPSAPATETVTQTATTAVANVVSAAQPTTQSTASKQAPSPSSSPTTSSVAPARRNTPSTARSSASTTRTARAASGTAIRPAVRAATRVRNSTVAEVSSTAASTEVSIANTAARIVERTALQVSTVDQLVGTATEQLRQAVDSGPTLATLASNVQNTSRSTPARSRSSGPNDLPLAGPLAPTPLPFGLGADRAPPIAAVRGSTNATNASAGPWSALLHGPRLDGDAARGAPAPQPARAPSFPLPTPASIVGAVSGAGGAGSSLVVFLSLASFLLAITSLRRRFRLTPELRWSPAYVAVSDRPG